MWLSGGIGVGLGLSAYSQSPEYAVFCDSSLCFDLKLSGFYGPIALAHARMGNKAAFLAPRVLPGFSQCTAGFAHAVGRHYRYC